MDFKQIIAALQDADAANDQVIADLKAQISAKDDQINALTKVDPPVVSTPAPVVTPVTPIGPVNNIPPVKFFDAAIDKLNDLSAYAHISGVDTSANVINPGLITVTSDPFYGSKRKVLLLKVKPTDTGGVTENARAQIQTPMSYVEGQEVFIGLSVRFATPLWTWFLTFSEIYGAPYAGTSPFRLGIQQSNLIASYLSKPTDKENHLYEKPMILNQWYSFVYREILSSDPTKGEIQVWLRMQGQKDFTEIVSTFKGNTISPANALGPNYQKLACYYDKNHTFTDATQKTKVSYVQMYLADHKVGSSFDQVAPPLIS
jgi:hypothetical protein